jgi:hypothetical protein
VRKASTLAHHPRPKFGFSTLRLSRGEIIAATTPPPPVVLTSAFGRPWRSLRALLRYAGSKFRRRCLGAQDGGPELALSPTGHSPGPRLMRRDSRPARQLSGSAARRSGCNRLVPNAHGWLGI